MQQLTEHEKKILELVKEHPEIVDDRSARKKIADEVGISEKTLRNRIADLKRYGLIPLTYDKIEQTRALSTDEINLLDYAKILLKWRKFFIVSVIVIASVAVVVSLIIPKTYKASAALMPPVSTSETGILGALSDLSLGGFFQPTSDERMNFIAILKSRTVMEKVIEQFHLIDFYHAENVEGALRSLGENSSFKVEEEGTIRISMSIGTGWFHRDEGEERAKQMCADIANFFVEQLDKVNKKLKTERASFHRMFIEARYRQNIEDLKEAENALKSFQEKHKMVSLNEQTSAAIEAAATIKGQILANEVQLGVMTKTLSPGHPNVEILKRETYELMLKLREMDFGSPNDPESQDKLFPLFSEVPDLGVQFMRLKRDVEIQNTLFTFLTQQYEEAKIQEAKDTPTIQVLDDAVRPEKRDKPFRALIVILATMIGGFFVSAGIIIYENNQQQTQFR